MLMLKPSSRSISTFFYDNKFVIIKLTNENEQFKEVPFHLMLHCLAMLCLSLWINTVEKEKFIFHWIQYIFIYGFHTGLKILVLIKYQCDIHMSISFRLRFSVSGQNQSSKRTFYPKGIYNNKHYHCIIVSCFGNCKVIIIICHILE